MTTIEKINDYKYSILLNKPCEVFLNAVLESKILSNNGIKISSIFNKLYLIANEVVYFKEFIEKDENKYVTSLNIIESFTPVIKCLEKKGEIFYGLNTNQIIVIDKSIFLYIDVETLFPILNKNEIKFYNPINFNLMLAPEILEIKTLPFSVNYKSFYYSLANLIYLVLLNSNEINEDFLDKIDFIKETKVYWFLVKNLNKCFKKRSLNLI